MQNPAFFKEKDMKTEEGLLERGTSGRAGGGQSVNGVHNNRRESVIMKCIIWPNNIC